MTTTAPNPVPVGPRRVHDQAIAAGFESGIKTGLDESSTVWSVGGKKNGTGFAGLWIQVGEAGVKNIGLWAWTGGTDLRKVSLTELRNLLERA